MIVCVPSNSKTESVISSVATQGAKAIRVNQSINPFVSGRSKLESELVLFESEDML